MHDGGDSCSQIPLFVGKDHQHLFGFAGIQFQMWDCTLFHTLLESWSLVLWRVRQQRQVNCVISVPDDSWAVWISSHRCTGWRAAVKAHSPEGSQLRRNRGQGRYCIHLINFSNSNSPPSHCPPVGIESGRMGLNPKFYYCTQVHKQF